MGCPRVRFVLALLLAAPLSAQDALVGIESTDFRTGADGIRLEAGGWARLPDRARLVLRVSMEGSTRTDVYVSTYVKDQAWKAVLGPFDRPLLPGTYAVFLDFRVQDQHPSLVPTLRQGALPLDQTRRVSVVRLGSAADEEEARAGARDFYLEKAKEARELCEELDGAIADIEARKRFHDPAGGLDIEAWKTWAAERVRRINASAARTEETWGDRYLLSYFPEVREAYASLVGMLRNSIVAHTRRLIRGTGAAAPDGFEMPEELESGYVSPTTTRAARESADRMERSLREWKPETEQDWAAYNLSDAEGRKLVEELLVVVMTSLRDAVEALGSRADDRARDFHAEAWEEELKGWNEQVDKSVPQLRPTGFRMAPDAFSLLSYRYPYVVPYLSELQANARAYGKTTSSWIYGQAGVAPPKGPGNEGPAPSADELVRERSDRLESFRQRLDYLQSWFSLKLPPEEPR